MIRPEIEFDQLIDIITTSATSETTDSKTRIETPPDEFLVSVLSRRIFGRPFIRRETLNRGYLFVH